MLALPVRALVTTCCTNHVKAAGMLTADTTLKTVIPMTADLSVVKMSFLLDIEHMQT